MVLVFVLIWVKSVLRCLLYIFHLSGLNDQQLPKTFIVPQSGKIGSQLVNSLSAVYLFCTHLLLDLNWSFKSWRELDVEINATYDDQDVFIHILDSLCRFLCRHLPICLRVTAAPSLSNVAKKVTYEMKIKSITFSQRLMFHIKTFQLGKYLSLQFLTEI